MKKFLIALVFAVHATAAFAVLSWTPPTPTVVNAGASYTLSAQDDVNRGAAAKIITIRLNGAIVQSFGGAGSATLSVSYSATAPTVEQLLAYTATVQMAAAPNVIVESTAVLNLKIDANPPTTPPAPSATASATSLALSWPASTDTMSSVTGYEIDRTGAGTVATSGTGYTITGLTPGTTYQIRVHASDTFGHWSPWGPYLNATTAPDPLLDQDGDGIANGWEAYYGLNFNSAADAALDSDGDGWTNREEFARGTDPTVADPSPSSTLVAALSGNFSVDNKGSANYTIPLKIPPGRSGMQPSLALSYSSGGANGPMGFGWSLSTGLPQSITRGRSIQARDDLIRGVNFDDTNTDLRYRDKFYLDGKRLICTSEPTTHYGAPGSTYRTEVDSFVTITTAGSGSNIDTFTVTDKSGTAMTFGKYGSAMDGYQMGALATGGTETKAYTYALKHVQDTVGNAVDFTYTGFTGGEYVLSEILYTANPLAIPAVTAMARVQCNYNGSARPDTTTSYVAGRLFTQSRRLDSINAQFDSGGGYTDVARYALEYATTAAGSRTRLMAVAPSLLNSTTSAFEATPKTTFTWSDAPTTSGAKVIYPLPSKSPANPTWGHNAFAWGDFNGDGKDDYAAISGDHTIVVYISNGSSFDAGANWGNILTLPGATSGNRTLMAADINGDGRKDLFIIDDKVATIYAAVSTGSSFTGLNGSTTVATTVATTGVAPHASLRDPSGTTFLLRDAERGGACARITAQDFTGDGCDDLLIHGYDGSFYLYRSQRTSMDAPVVTAAVGPSSNVNVWLPWFGATTNYEITRNYTINPMPGDFNGDGRTDYAWISFEVNAPTANYYFCKKELFVSLALPDGTFSAAQQFDISIAAGSVINQDALLYYVLPGDFNGDGLGDFLVHGKDPGVGGPRWLLLTSTGSNGSGGVGFKRQESILPESITYGGEQLPTFFRPVEPGAWISWNLSVPPNPNQSQFGYQDPILSATLAKVQSTLGEHTMAQDINQDGLTDLVWYVWKNTAETSAANRGWYVMYGTGTGFGSVAKLTGHPWDDTAGNIIPLSTSNQQSSPTTVSLSRGADINGDGLPDWTFNYSSIDRDAGLQGCFLGQGARANLITGFNAGIGGRTEVIYKAAKDDSVYTKGADVSYPIREIRGSNPVVSDIYKDAGDYFGFFGQPLYDASGLKQRNLAQFSYQYSGNRLDLSGRGGLGFHSFITLDRQTNLFKYQFLAQSFPMTGLTHREETYRYLGGTSFNIISSHDNTVVFDKVSTYGTLWPFISKATESRWEDGAGAFTTALGASISSNPENVFLQTKPAGAHIAITAKSWFDGSVAAEPQTTLPGVSGYNPSDFNGSANTVAGTTNGNANPLTVGSTFYGLPGNITNGNLTKLYTDYGAGSGYTETVTTTYLTSSALPSRIETVTTSVTGGGYSEVAPVKTYTYEGNTPLVKTETITAGGNLNTTTTYARDPIGRVTATSISGTDLQSIGQGSANYTVSQATAFDARWDAPTITKDTYDHATTAVYHAFLGQPTSVTDVNGAQVTTVYDAMGRVTQQTDVLKSLTTDTAFAWTSSGATDWKRIQTVAGPLGWSGVASGAPITGVTGVALTSAYAVRNTTTVAPAVTTYYDRLGRVIRTIKEGFGGQQICTDAAYNSLGQAIASSLPYPFGGAPLWTKTAYDALGRVVTVTAPNGTVTTNTYKGRATLVGVDALNLGGVDPAEQVNATVVDAKGRTVSVWNADNVPTFSDNLGTASANATPSIAFTLDGFGRMRVTTLKGQGQTITAGYDTLGRQTSLNDPDKGNWTYTNSALGHVLRQTDARGNITDSIFDRLGRPLKRTTTGNEVADFYYYDTAANVSAYPTQHLVESGAKGWIGAPEREDCSATGSFATTNLHYYDTKGRPSIEAARTDGKWFYTYSDYDLYSRVRQVRHFWKPSGAELPNQQPYLWQDFGYTYTYDTRSYLTALADSLGRSWWDTPNYDYMDRVTSVRKGASLITTRSYRDTDGVLTGITTASIQTLGFAFDGLGNLTSRTDTNVSGGENLLYDNLNRLTSSKQGAMTYFANGNILTKPDVTSTGSGNYVYDLAQPHAVHTAFGYTMAYDANGNLTSRSKAGDTSTVQWCGFDKPRWLGRTTASGTVGSEFHYNAARSRVMQLEFNAMNGAGPTQYNRKRVYALGSTLELNYTTTTPALNPTWDLKKVRIYVPGPDGIIGAREFDVTSGTTGTEKALVYHYDHLGSITATTLHTTGTLANDTGGKAGKFSEDAWGQRRNPSTWSGAPTTTDDGNFDSLTPRGYTGHEMLDDLGLVHMNGRIYDPLLGRMLSADAFVQFPGSLQSYNRYSYVMNNPLTFTDPSGFFQFPQHEKIMTNAYNRLFSDTTWGFIELKRNGSDEKYKVPHANFIRELRGGSIKPDMPDGAITGLWMMADRKLTTSFYREKNLDAWKAFWSGNETYESHFGSKQYLHAMQSKETTATELQNNIVNSITERVVKAKTALADGDWKKGAELLGSAGHTVADSFSRSHVERDQDGTVIRFRNYNEQDSAEHAVADKEEKKEFDMATTATEKLLKYSLSDNFTEKGLADLIRKEIIPITKDTQVGSDGNDEFKKKQKDKR